MLFKMYGRRTARIKKYIDGRHHHCQNCKSFDLDIKVYRDYYHYILIPFIPTGDKTAKIYCNKCGEGIRTESIRKEFEVTTKTPFYLYSGLIVAALMIIFVAISEKNERDETAKYLADPRAGDIYSVSDERNNLQIYSFMRVNEVTDDSVYLFPNDLDYYGVVTRFVATDFFRENEQLAFSMHQLKLMLDTGAIHFVKRGYSSEDGFQRLKIKD